MARSTWKTTLVVVGLVALAVASRMAVLAFPQIPPNFHAVAAVALFAGFYFRSALVAVCVPTLAMAVSNYWIGSYDTPVLITVYAALAFPVALRSILRRRQTNAGPSPLALGGSAVTSSVVFFLTTNFAVWCCWSSVHTLGTLLTCYTVAIPFFGYSLCGDLAYTGALFGAYAAYRLLSAASARQAAPATVSIDG